ncbi:twin-arginine translocation pathway signal protein [Sphingomonas sp. ASY06-1R]|uniref:twin-arginine translocation pathway signal protein n=1 Tax=Sphingomonas sp. ASY06-1R TaxID=3445771 RepID=UPI003FA335C1
MTSSRHSLFLAAAVLAVPLAARAQPAAAPAAATKPASAPAFIPATFTPPTRIEGPGFVLVPLGPEVVKLDYDAYMSSIDHLQKTFSRSTNWPREGITDADAMKDMEGEQARFRARKSFAYAVLTPDGRRERGSVYVSPSPVPGHDAVVRLWVTKADYDAGFDAALYQWVRAWVARDWPFRTVAYPGRAIDWATWDAAVAASKRKAAAGGTAP